MKNILLTLSTVLIYSSTYALSLPVYPLKSYECTRCVQLSHELLNNKWAITNSQLDLPSNNKQTSYSYRQKVTAEQLQAGVLLHTLAPGAVIRISPINNDELLPLSLQTHEKKPLSLKDASSLYVQDEALQNPYASYHETMAQIKPELGHGSFILKSLKQGHKKNTYIINVFDKFSLTHLDVETSSLYYKYGDTVKALISLQDDINSYDVKNIEASLVSPAGQITPMTIKEVNDNQFEASFPLTSELSDNGENWYVKVNVESTFDEETVKRNAQTAFSYSIPSATVHQVKLLSQKPLTFRVDVEVATASRYSLQGVLFNKNNQSLIATETSQTSAWLEPGVQSLEFTFDNSQQLSEDNLYLGYLRLVDYGQLKLVYHYDKPIQLSQLVE